MNSTAPDTASPLPLSATATDEELAARAAQGDAAAFETIMRRHNRLLFRSARSVLRDDAEAEEVVQDAYLKAWRGLANFRGQSRLSTWLVRIALNESFTRRRRTSAVVIPIDAEALAEEEYSDVTASPPHSDPERSALLAEMRRAVESHIDRLPEQFRTVFVLRAVQELDVDEIAQALQIPAATVRTRYFRARALLREALARDVDFAIEEAFSFDGARCDRIVETVMQSVAKGER
jgi:RNA polymerase sigma-70 factor (ECF subfamily)